MSAPSLDVRGLAFAYPDGHQALYGVDLTIARGERVALLGPNGAGKTPLVLHLNGILAAGAGSVTVAGLPVTKENLQEIRRRVGIVFQNHVLFEESVEDNITYGLRLRGMAEDEAREKAAAEGFIGMHYPEEYGGSGYGVLENALVIEGAGRLVHGTTSWAAASLQ